MTVGYEKNKVSNAKYRERNLEACRARDREYKRERYHNDEEFKLKKQAQARERVAMLREEKINSGVEIRPRGRPKKTYTTLKTLDEMLVKEVVNEVIEENN